MPSSGKTIRGGFSSRARRRTGARWGARLQLFVALFALLTAREEVAVAAVIGQPDRRTVAEWAAANGIDAAAAGDRFAATGEVVCSWTDANGAALTGYSTGQVTLARDVVTMAGHAFFDLATCAPKARPGACTFIVETGTGSTETAAVVAVEAIGFDCRNSRQPLAQRIRSDWAVVRLERPLPVEPYRVPDAVEGLLAPGAPVRSVVFSQDYLVPVAGADIHPKTVGECAVRDVLRHLTRLAYFTTDCDGAQRSSGGSLLTAGGDAPTLVGIWAAANEDSWLLVQAIDRIRAAGGYRDDLANSGPYEVNTWSSRHIPVNGALLEAIKAAAAASAAEES